MITVNMQKFIESNKLNLVVYGERLTPEGMAVMNKSDLDRSDRIFYRLDDGKEFLLLSGDTKSAPEFIPQWALE